MRPEAFDLLLRIVVEAPVPGVAMALQRGPSATATLIGPIHASAEVLTFDFEVTVSGSGVDGAPRLLGPFVQGPPTGRFVYVNSGTYAGETGSIWQRRAKVPLTGLSWPPIEALPPGGRLEARIAGKARDGGPACASVALLPPGWRGV